MATATQPNVSQQQLSSWESQQGPEQDQDVVNPSNERAAYLIGGSVLTLVGLRRRSTLGALLAIAGGSLIYKGMQIGAEQQQ